MSGSGAVALWSESCPAGTTEPPQLLVPVATCGRHQPVTDCLLPTRRHLLLNAQLPSNQTETRSAEIVELSDDLEHLLQRNRTQHPRQAPRPRPSVVMWGASAVLSSDAPPRRVPRSLIDKPHCAPLKLVHKLHKDKATKKW
jgi:hypothetical protein